MSIEPGKYYRRKSEGIKMMALEKYDTRRWRFYVPEGQAGGCNNRLDDVSNVEPWTEPKKKVKLWQALYRARYGGEHYLSSYLYSECPPDAVRLATEYPAIEVEE